MKNNLVTHQAYFDCNATTPVLPEAAQAALEAMRTLYGNPSSTHLVGLQAKHILENTRQLASRVIGSEPEQIIFTSGATEAIHTAIFSALQSLKKKSHPLKILYVATEHKAVPQALQHWVSTLDLPFEIAELPVDSEGQVKIDVLRRELPQAALLCSMAVNNETGIIQDLEVIEQVFQETESKALWLVDCVQALGKLDLHLNSSRIDYAALSGHKLYAPKGIGLLYIKKGSPIFPLIVGGGQEKGLRSGTENLPGVAALGAVLEKLLDKSGNSGFHSHKKQTLFRDQLISELKSAFPEIQFNTCFERSVPTTINFSVPGFTSKELLDLFDAAGLRLSSGSACNSTSVKPSHVLEAMGIPHGRSMSALRLSFGPCTSEKEIERGCQLIRESSLALKNACLMSTSGAFEAPENLRDGILQFRMGPTNSWVIADKKTRRCILLDPCDGVAERMVHYVLCQGLEVLAILDTHSHEDHPSVRTLLQRILANQVKIAEFDSNSLGWPISHSSQSDVSVSRVTLDNHESIDAIQIGETEMGRSVLARLHTPGHTDDSYSFLFGIVQGDRLKKENIQYVFSGDTILSGGLGRTNFSMSNPTDLFHSLRNLKEVLSFTTLICPTHDYNNSFATRLETEIEENPLLALALSPMTPLTLDQFLTQKNQIDTQLAHLEKELQEVVCWVTSKKKTGQEKTQIRSSKDLKEFMTSENSMISSSCLVIDVREAQEFSLFKDWDEIGFKQPPRNVPISRLVNFIRELLETKSFRQEILFICRSGNRSLQATKSLRRLGFERVWSLDGGMALCTGHNAINVH